MEGVDGTLQRPPTLHAHERSRRGRGGHRALRSAGSNRSDLNGQISPFVIHGLRIGPDLQKKIISAFARCERVLIAGTAQAHRELRGLPGLAYQLFADASLIGLGEAWTEIAKYDDALNTDQRWRR